MSIRHFVPQVMPRRMAYRCAAPTYTSQTTGTLVPLLHIVPSETDAERLIPMSPELVTVLLAVQRRAKVGGAHVPLSVRYDPHEGIHGEPFPHLFARRFGTRQEVIAYAVVRRLLGEVAAMEESLKHLRQRRAEAETSWPRRSRGSGDQLAVRVSLSPRARSVAAVQIGVCQHTRARRR